MIKVTTHGAITRIELARTLFGRPLFTVSAYLFEDTLIDSGPPHTARELLRWCDGRTIARIVNTHHHEDHSGGDALLSDALGVPVQAPAAAVPLLADFERLPPYRRLVWGQPRNLRAQALEGEVRAGSRVLRVVPTPGHSPDHVCLFEPEEGLLFGGDLYISPRARYMRRDEDAWGIVASLGRARALRPRVLFCAHAGIVPDAEQALAAKASGLERLAEQALKLRDGGLPTGAIATRMLGREGLLAWVSLGDFSKRNLVRSLLRPPAR